MTKCSWSTFADRTTTRLPALASPWSIPSGQAILQVECPERMIVGRRPDDHESKDCSDICSDNLRASGQRNGGFNRRNVDESALACRCLTWIERTSDTALGCNSLSIERFDYELGEQRSAPLEVRRWDQETLARHRAARKDPARPLGVGGAPRLASDTKLSTRGTVCPSRAQARWRPRAFSAF